MSDVRQNQKVSTEFIETLIYEISRKSSQRSRAVLRGRTDVRRDEANMAMFTAALPKVSQHQQQRHSLLHIVRCG